MSDESRKIVLGRRARFVAAAIAGLGTTAALDACKPQVCLEPAYVPEDASRDVEPPNDGGTDALLDGSAKK